MALWRWSLAMTRRLPSPTWRSQCGGRGYTGCTTCASGSTCRASNEWYSQCL
ncbi:hypothetical protein V8F06_014539 [Rhypophila decipiens]